MSSDSDQTPQAGKRKKFLFPVSDDSDDSDYSIVQLRTRRKIFRVISEDESSDDDSDSQRANGNDTSYESTGSNARKPIDFGETSDTSEWQSDWSSSTEAEPERRQPVKRKVVGKTKNKRLTNPIASSPEIESDSSSDEQSEKCPICLIPFRKQQLGVPSSCEHCFCLECLIEWSKNINTCPIDRETFTVIHVLNELGGDVINDLPVKVVPRIEDQVQEDPTFCEVCHQCDREDRMLLCDGCDCGYHLECLTPPMSEVPLEEWFCPECSHNSQSDAETVEIDVDEIPDLMEEARRLGVSYGRTRTGLPNGNQSSPRIIPRTRHTERVRAILRNRARLFENRLSRPRGFDPNQPSTSSGLDSFGDNSRSRSPSNASNSRTSKKSTSRSARGSRTTKRKSTKRSARTLVREVRITEYNENGEQEEIVTYVKVAVGNKKRSGRSKRITRRKRKVHSSL